MFATLSRRYFCRLAVTFSLITGLSLASAHAQTAESARSMMQRLGQQVVAIVNSSAPLAQKKAQLLPIIEQNVNVDAIAKYCLGRYWRVATPEQKQEYLSLFRKVLVNSITNKIGEYRGVAFQIGQATTEGSTVSVASILTRPGQPPADVRWVLDRKDGRFMVVDMVAEHASLRMTQRQDYASYIVHNGGTVDALLKAMKRQIAKNN